LFLFDFNGLDELCFDSLLASFLGMLDTRDTLLALFSDVPGTKGAGISNTSKYPLILKNKTTSVTAPVITRNALDPLLIFPSFYRVGVSS
jgi:hypothetical protein